MQHDDLAYVQHMLLNATKVVGRVQGLDRSVFDANEDLQIIFSHLIQTIGESARRVSPDFRVKYPLIPWKDLTGIRSKIVHDYLDVDFDVIWDVATGDLGPLIKALTQIIR